MAKFDRLTERYLAEVDPQEIKDNIEYLKSIAEALEQAISHYTDQMLLCDTRETWYSNARDAYDRKKDKTLALIKKLEDKLASLPPQ